jgi:hypothetical protein
VLRLRAGDPRQVGPFRLLARLGSGGMGQVYLGVGWHGELVAVKLVHRGFAHDEQFRIRFRREVTTSGQVAGPWTARAVAADPDASIPWLATEYVPGPGLDRAVQETGPLPQATLHVLAAGLAGALAAIHAAGLVHRDGPADRGRARRPPRHTPERRVAPARRRHAPADRARPRAAPGAGPRALPPVVPGVRGPTGPPRRRPLSRRSLLLGLGALGVVGAGTAAAVGTGLVAATAAPAGETGLAAGGGFVVATR